jgi:hypothetical protein
MEELQGERKVVLGFSAGELTHRAVVAGMNDMVGGGEDACGSITPI